MSSTTAAPSATEQPDPDRVTFTYDELLADVDYAEPLVVEGVRCHGGFDADGTYRSPRTRFRVPAIEAWDRQRLAQFDTPKLDIGLETWPEHFPNVAQTRFLLDHGAPEPTISELTRIGTVEGFGALLRHSPMPEFGRCFAEDIDGTAIAHLAGGLYEAHARDEAGHDEAGRPHVAGHKEMWFLARDVAFDHPVTEDQTDLMLERMGIPIGDPAEMAKLRARAEATRLLPGVIEFELESLVARMIRLLFIEITAFHAFAWAEEVLADTNRLAGDGFAAKLISYVRQDENPHVAYLGTTLSEMRDRTWLGRDGSHHEGAEMIGTLWEASLEQSINQGRQDFLAMAVREVRAGLEGRPDADDLFDEFLSLGSVTARDDGTWVDATDGRRTAG
jgi:hypothetical protein